MRKLLLFILSIIYIICLAGMLQLFVVVGSLYIISELILMLFGYIVYRLIRKRNRRKHFWSIWIYSTFIGFIPLFQMINEMDQSKINNIGLVILVPWVVKFIAIIVLSRVGGEKIPSSNVSV